jgi:hypothetical protein
MTRGPALARRRPSAWKPACFLLLCAPVVVDLLFGATQVNTLVALIPETLTYGCAALLIRGLARHHRAGWATVITWGLAYAVIAECLIVQTSLAPRLDGPGQWGRALGVNWPYLIWAAGYESCWAIALSIQLTHLMFPAHRDTPWPGHRGQLLLAVVFVLGAVPTWYNWTHIVAPKLLHQPVYQPPPLTLVVALAVAAAVAVLGTRLTQLHARPNARPPRDAPAPVSAAGVTFAATTLWFALLLPKINSMLVAVPAALPIACALLTAGMAGALLRRWSRARGWNDRHRLMVVFGALTASMAAGFPANEFTTHTLLAKVGLNAAAAAGLILLYRRVGMASGREKRHRVVQAGQRGDGDGG